MSYQEKCLNESSLGISTLCGLFPLSANEDVNTIPVPDVVCISVADVVAVADACKIGYPKHQWTNVVILLQRMNSDCLSSGNMARLVQSIYDNVKTQFLKVHISRASPISVDLLMKARLNIERLPTLTRISRKKVSDILLDIFIFNPFCVCLIII